MYHTNMNDIQQQTLGLYGPIVILEPDEEWDPAYARLIVDGIETPARRARAVAVLDTIASARTAGYRRLAEQQFHQCSRRGRRGDRS